MLLIIMRALVNHCRKLRKHSGMSAIPDCKCRFFVFVIASVNIVVANLKEEAITIIIRKRMICPFSDLPIWCTPATLRVLLLVTYYSEMLQSRPLGISIEDLQVQIMSLDLRKSSIHTFSLYKNHLGANHPTEGGTNQQQSRSTWLDCVILHNF